MGLRSFYLIIIINFFALGSAVSQSWPDMMESESSLDQVQAAAEPYFENLETLRGKGWKPYKRWEYFVESRVDEEGNVPGRQASQLLSDALQSPSLRGQGYANWFTKGPFDVPIGGYGAGRLNCVAFHPTDPDILFVGAPSGGLWATTNGGMSWFTHTDDLALLGVTDILINPNNPNEMLIATGDAYGSHTYSMGVLRSTDGGVTWASTGLSWGAGTNAQISKLVMVPGASNIVLAATKSGLYRSSDGGISWNLSKPGSFRDIDFKPGSPAIVYAVTNSTLWSSSDTGSTFSLNTAFQTTASVERLSLAVTANDPNYIYILAVKNSDSGFEGLYQSTDGGTSFVKRASTPNLLGFNLGSPDQGGQGWYDLALAASPLNKDLVIVGGINAWRSTDGGGSWSIVAHGYNNNYPNIHPDIHELTYNTLNNRLYACTDGGVYYSTDNGSSWTSRSDGLSIAQMYRIGVSQTDAGLVLSGWQDNGSNLFFNNSAWKKVLGGDGMECIIDYNNANFMYGTLYYGYLRRSTNAGTSWSDIGTTITEEGAWVTPFVMDPVNPSILYAAYNNLWRSPNRGTSFAKISSLSTTATMRSLAVAPSNTQVIYMATLSTLYRSTDGGTNWMNISSGLSNGYISDIAVSSNDPYEVYVTKSGYYNGNKVWRSTNGGGAWTNISGSLPNLPANTIVYERGKADALYVGLDAGVFYRDSLMSDWVPFNDNLPNVIINDLEIQYSDHKLVAGTFGRGLWMTDTWDWINEVPENPGDTELQIRVFPNPSSDFIEVNPVYKVYDQGILTITDGIGKVVFSKDFSNYTQAERIDVSAFSPGVYIITLRTQYAVQQARFVRN